MRSGQFWRVITRVTDSPVTSCFYITAATVLRWQAAAVLCSKHLNCFHHRVLVPTYKAGQPPTTPATLVCCIRPRWWEALGLAPHMLGHL